MNTVAGLFFLATLVEGLIQYVAGEKERPRPYLRYVSLALGVVLAVAYKLDIPAIAGISADYAVVNYVVSGIIIGRGSNYLNDIISHFKKSE